MRHYAERGFTMIEILLVVLLIGVIAAAGLRLPSLIAPTRAFEADVFAVMTAGYRAQMLAATGREDSAWGVHLAEGAATVFRGTTFTGRDVEDDELLPLESDSVLSGSSEVVFLAGSALPTDVVSFVLTSDTMSATVSVDTLGVIDVRYAE